MKRERSPSPSLDFEFPVVVKTTDFDAPRWWICDRKGTPKTNVVRVSWNKEKGKWLVHQLPQDHPKPSFVGYATSLEEAVKLRLSVQQKEGRRVATRPQLTNTGAVVKRCSMCLYDFSITSFAPNPCKYKKKFSEFRSLCDDVSSLDKDISDRAFQVLSILPGEKGHYSASWCRHCREIKSKTTQSGDGNYFADCVRMCTTIKDDMMSKGCKACGETKNCLECDHPNRTGKDKPFRGKKGAVLDPSYWALKYRRNGPSMMWEDYLKCDVLCKVCHSLQDSHQTNHAGDASKCNNSDVRRHIVERAKKKEFNNAKKREVGKCSYCGLLCTLGKETAFHWMHKNEEEKEHSVSHLVRDCRKADTVIPILEREYTKCSLGCANCHHLEDTLPRLAEGNDGWDELMQMPVVKSCSAVTR